VVLIYAFNLRILTKRPSIW